MCFSVAHLIDSYCRVTEHIGAVAVFVVLVLPRYTPEEVYAIRDYTLGERLLTQGPSALNRRELLALLRNADSMAEIHDRLWKTPDRQLPEWWKMAMRHYNLLTGRPRTPLYR